MFALNLPPYDTRIKTQNGQQKIFDVLRKKYVVLTPEEWVRQHFVHYLIRHKHYPASLLSNEVTLHVGEKSVRADTILYNRNLKPTVLIEYKAPNIKLSQKVFDQISTYNLLLHVDYLIVSNGLETYACKMNYEQQSYYFLEAIPDYENILQNNG